MGKPRVIIFGAGGYWLKYEQDIRKKYEVVAISDNNRELHKKLKEYVAPEKIDTVEYDYIFIMSMYYEQIFNQLINMGINWKKIIVHSEISDLPDTNRGIIQNESYLSYTHFNSLENIIQHIRQSMDRESTELEKVKSLLIQIKEDISKHFRIDIEAYKYYMKNNLVMDRSRKTYLWYLRHIVSLIEDSLKDLSNNFEILYETLEKLMEEIKLISHKPKITFLAREMFMWASLKSVYDAFNKSNQYDVQLIYLPGIEHSSYYIKGTDFELYKSEGYDVLDYMQIDLNKECPDIVFYATPYCNDVDDRFAIDKVKHICKRAVYIPYGFEIAGGEWIYRLQFGLPFHKNMWKIIGYSEHYKELAKERGQCNAKNVVVTGHPRLDLIYNISKEITNISPSLINKINGRKVVLWHSHFSIAPRELWGSYLFWKDAILDYFSKNKDMFLLWRPHPKFWRMLQAYYNLTEEEIIKFKNEMDSKDNIAIDDDYNYLNAFYLSSCMIGDGTSFLVEYLATGKPILYTPKYDGQGISDANLVKNYYIANSEEYIHQFLDMVKSGKDPLYEKRMDTCKKYLGNIDGKIGESIKEYLMKELHKEEEIYSIK